MQQQSWRMVAGESEFFAEDNEAAQLQRASGINGELWALADIFGAIARIRWNYNGNNGHSGRWASPRRNEYAYVGVWR